MNLEIDKIAMIYVNEFDGRKIYSIRLSKKNKDGSYENGFMSVRFKKDVVLENRTRIKVKKAFLSFNTNEGKTFPYIFINEDSELLYKCNSLNTSNEIYKHKQEEIEFLANYTFEQVEINPEDLPF